jgi:hypothetical protein
MVAPRVVGVAVLEDVTDALAEAEALNVTPVLLVGLKLNDLELPVLSLCDIIPVALIV